MLLGDNILLLNIIINTRMLYMKENKLADERTKSALAIIIILFALKFIYKRIPVAVRKFHCCLTRVDEGNLVQKLIYFHGRYSFKNAFRSIYILDLCDT